MTVSRVDWPLAEAVSAITANNWNAADLDTAGVSRDTALEWAAHGSESLVAASDAYMSQLESVLPETGRARWTHDIAGAFPNVPRYLAGADPRVMRRKRLFQEDRAPIRIYVDMTASMSITADQFMKRGTAVLALLRAAEMVRPVELYASYIATRKSGSLHTIQIVNVRLPSAPLNISLAAAWVSHPAIFRRCLANRPYTEWRNAYPVSINNAPALKTLMGLNPSDIYIVGCHGSDPSVVNSVQWIKDRLAEIGANQESGDQL